MIMVIFIIKAVRVTIIIWNRPKKIHSDKSCLHFLLFSGCFMQLEILMAITVVSLWITILMATNIQIKYILIMEILEILCHSRSYHPIRYYY